MSQSYSDSDSIDLPIRTTRKRKRNDTTDHHAPQADSRSGRRDSFNSSASGKKAGKSALVPRSLKQAAADGEFDITGAGEDEDSEYDEPNVVAIKGGPSSRGRKRTADIDVVQTTQALAQLKTVETPNVVMIDGGPKYRGYKRVADIDTVLARQAARKPRSVDQQYNDCADALDFLSSLPSLPAGLESLVVDARTILGQSWKYFFLYTDYVNPETDDRGTWSSNRRGHLTVVQFFVERCRVYQKEVSRATFIGHQLDCTDADEKLLPLVAEIKKLGQEAEEEGAAKISMKEWERPGAKDILEGEEMEVVDVEEESDGSDDDDDNSDSDGEDPNGKVSEADGAVGRAGEAEGAERAGPGYGEMDWEN
ncbi:hypothetical protein LTR09_000294 [Extremus antarcticus]|uniref:Uncharacterized protein n=1 Tax=Extremus antarcticus TaxID=702011 RepID=A0AAJ0GJD7_9PEZI|nr:hypothetical protein LTR09_000294 [Extremus antarcticus]